MICPILSVAVVSVVQELGAAINSEDVAIYGGLQFLDYTDHSSPATDRMEHIICTLNGVFDRSLLFSRRRRRLLAGRGHSEDVARAGSSIRGRGAACVKIREAAVDTHDKEVKQ